MSKSYTPGLKVLENTIVNKKRILPLPGKVHVKEGDSIDSEIIVASTQIPGNVQMINVANELNIDPEQVPESMLVSLNDTISSGQIIARSRGLFGMFKTEIKSPIDGVLTNISNVTGQIIISEKPIEIQIDAYIPGLIDDVIDNEGVVIKSSGAFIQGIIGIGGEKKGILTIIENENSSSNFLDINANYKGKILVIKGYITYDTYIHANKIGVAGILCGGIDYSTLSKILGYPLGVAITGTEDVTTLVITEGFGNIVMAKKTYNLLKNNHNKEVSINGATQIRAGVMRPEIFIGHDDKYNTSDEFNEDELIISVGSKVRIIREPFFGTIGNVIELPPKLLQMDTETMARAAIIKFEDGTEKLIPRANLEVILTD